MPAFVACVALVTACSPAGPPAVAQLASGEPNGAPTAGPSAAAVTPVIDPEDTRPTDHVAPAPPGDFAPIAYPEDVHLEPPPEGWWTKKDACPAGRKIVSESFELHRKPWTAHHCEGKGGPSTSTRDDADEREEGWWDEDGKPHGAIRWLTVGYDETKLYVHGSREGRWTSRARDGSQNSFETYRADRCHGERRHDLGSYVQSGWCVDGDNQGTWFVWNKKPDVVRARLRYTGGELDGAQRWWTRDGAVLARGAFTAGEGTWTILPPGGKARSETRCKGRVIVEITAWDTSQSTPRLALRICGRGAPSSCTPTGPTDAREQLALGAHTLMCDEPMVPPLELF